LRFTAYTALLIGIVAAALDFSSGYSLTGAGQGMMAESSTTVVAGCLLILGAVAIATGIAAVLPRMEARARRIGFVMEVCGVAMAALSAWAPLMAPLTDFAMLAVGGLMVLNGALMQRRLPMTPRV